MRKGLYLSCGMMYRGDVTPQDVWESVNHFRNSKEFSPAHKVPSIFHPSITREPISQFPNWEMTRVPRSLSLLTNHTAICNSMFKEMARKFDLLRPKRAFAYW